ncbi:MAG TPA: hypothetical protein VJW23_15890 [Propionibacteriaceae bacterium]|nr:hypothetical protein [Propionibacteriaceae bacterium]
MSEENEPEESPEAKALNAIAGQITGLRKEHRKPKPFFGASATSVVQQLTGYDPVEARENERIRREREQAKLYKLVVLIAAISAVASIASVIVAVISA